MAIVEPPRARDPALVRRERMLALVRARAYVSVGELSARFDVSEVTVRSDLRSLVADGKLRRVRGGAIPRTLPGPPPHGPRREQDAIGRAAAALVRDGQAVLLDAGALTAAVARALVARRELREVVVFVNSIQAAAILADASPRLMVVMLGGRLTSHDGALVGPLATLMLDQLNPHTLILGCDGADPQAGLTCSDESDAAVKRRMVQVARRVVVVADGACIGRRAAVALCRVDLVDAVLTGRDADARVVDALRRRHCDVTIV